MTDIISLIRKFKKIMDNKSIFKNISLTRVEDVLTSLNRLFEDMIKNKKV